MIKVPLVAFKNIENSPELLLSELELSLVDTLCRWPLGEPNDDTQKRRRKVAENAGRVHRPWGAVTEWR